MYTAINSRELDFALTDFADLVKDKTYKKFPYDRWKEFVSKFKGKCIEIEGDDYEIEIHSNDRKSMTLDPCDQSLGTFLWSEFREDYSEYGMSADFDKEHAFGQDLVKVKCNIASSEVNKNMSKIMPDAIRMRIKAPNGDWMEVSPEDVSVQCTSSNCYSARNYKIDLDHANLDMGCSLKKPIDEILKDKKEKENMKGFNFDFGPCTNDNVRMSMYGLAVQNNAGVWVSYNSKAGEIIDVDILNFDARKYMFKMPVAIKDIKKGDIVVHNRIPMFVVSIDNGITAVDVRAGEEKKIIPTTNMFGFNFVTKIVSMFDAVGQAPTPDAPFGNMLPFMLLGEDGGKDMDPMMLMLMMNSNGGMSTGFDMSNPMMLYFLMSKDGKNSDMLPFMMMMGMNGAQAPAAHTCNCGNAQ